MSTALRFNAMHFMPYSHLPENHREYKSLWVNFPNRYYDPEKGHELYQRYLQELVLADRLGYDAIVVNEHHNTVYSMMATPNLIAAAIIPADDERQDLRLGHAAQFHVAEPPRRGIRDSRRPVEGPPRGRLPARHRNGVLGAPGQPGDRPRQVQGIAQDHPAGVDAGRAHHALRQLLHVPVPEPVAAPVPEAASALLHRRHGEPGDDRDRRRARVRLCVGLRHPRRARASSTRACGSAPPTTATRFGRISCRC